MEDSSIAVESPPEVGTESASGGPESFNFQNPGHSIRDGIRRLESAHEAFAARLERSLSDSFGKGFKLSLQGIEQAGEDRYLSELPTQGVLAVLSLKPFPGKAVFELSAEAGFPLIEAMLGGVADTDIDRKPTPVERQLLQGVAEDAVTALAEALRPLGLEVAAEDWHADPQFMDTGSDDLVILVRYGLAFGDDGDLLDRLVLSYPLAALQALAEGKFDVESDPDEAPVSSLALARLEDHLPDVRVPFTVRLRPSSVLFTDLATLEPGDVLRLDNAIDDPIVGLVGGLPLVVGKLGMSKHTLAMEIAGWTNND